MRNETAIIIECSGLVCSSGALAGPRLECAYCMRDNGDAPTEADVWAPTRTDAIALAIGIVFVGAAVLVTLTLPNTPGPGISCRSRPVRGGRDCADRRSTQIRAAHRERTEAPRRGDRRASPGLEGRLEGANLRGTQARWRSFADAATQCGVDTTKTSARARALQPRAHARGLWALGIIRERLPELVGKAAEAPSSAEASA